MVSVVCFGVRVSVMFHFVFVHCKLVVGISYIRSKALGLAFHAHWKVGISELRA